MKFACPLVLTLAAVLMVRGAFASTRDYYTAAVFEHNRMGDDITDNPSAVIRANLENYERAAKAAAEQVSFTLELCDYTILRRIRAIASSFAFIFSILNLSKEGPF